MVKLGLDNNSQEKQLIRDFCLSIAANPADAELVLQPSKHQNKDIYEGSKDQGLRRHIQVSRRGNCAQHHQASLNPLDNFSIAESLQSLSFKHNPLLDQRFKRIAVIPLDPGSQAISVSPGQTSELQQQIMSDSLMDALKDVFPDPHERQEYVQHIINASSEIGSANKFFYGKAAGSFHHNIELRHEGTGGYKEITSGAVGCLTAAAGAKVGMIIVAAGALSGGTAFIVIAGGAVLYGVVGGIIGSGMADGMREDLEEAFNDSSLLVNVKEEDGRTKLGVTYYADANDGTGKALDLTRNLTSRGPATGYDRRGQRKNISKADRIQQIKNSRQNTKAKDVGQSFIYTVDANGNLVKASSSLIIPGYGDDQKDMRRVERQGLKEAESKIESGDIGLALTVVDQQGSTREFELDGKDVLSQLHMASELVAFIDFANAQLTGNAKQDQPLIASIDAAMQIMEEHIEGFGERFRQVQTSSDPNRSTFEEFLNLYARVAEILDTNIRAGRIAQANLRELEDAIEIGRGLLTREENIQSYKALEDVALIEHALRSGVPYHALVSPTSLDLLNQLSQDTYQSRLGEAGPLLINNTMTNRDINSEVLQVLAQELSRDRRKFISDLFFDLQRGPAMRSHMAEELLRSPEPRGLDKAGFKAFSSVTKDIGFVPRQTDGDAEYTYLELKSDLENDANQDISTTVDMSFTIAMAKRIAMARKQSYDDSIFIDFIANGEPGDSGARARMLEFIDEQPNLDRNEKSALKLFLNQLHERRFRSFRNFDIFRLDSPSLISSDLQIKNSDGSLVDNRLVYVMQQVFDGPKSSVIREGLGVNHVNEFIDLVRSAFTKLAQQGVNPFAGQIAYQKS